ncbi:MAG: fibronectin type III domain-containing protein [Spirochaetia bacterium]
MKAAEVIRLLGLFAVLVVLASCTPDAPGNLEARALSSTEVELTWTETTDGADSYTVYVQTAAVNEEEWEPFVTGAATEARIVLSDLSEGGAYRYRVTAANGGRESGLSNPVDVATPSESPTIVAFSGQTETSTRSITLKLIAEDDASVAGWWIGGPPVWHPGGGTEYFPPPEADSRNWEPAPREQRFEHQLQLDVSRGYGTKTYSARVIDAVKNVSEVSSFSVAFRPPAGQMSLDTLVEWTYSPLNGLIDESRGVFFYFDQDLFMGDVDAYDHYVFSRQECGADLTAQLPWLAAAIRRNLSDSSFEAVSCAGATCTIVEPGEYGDTITLTFAEGSDRRPVLIDVAFIGNRYPARDGPIVTTRSCP